MGRIVTRRGVGGGSVGRGARSVDLTRLHGGEQVQAVQGLRPAPRGTLNVHHEHLRSLGFLKESAGHARVLFGQGRIPRDNGF